MRDYVRAENEPDFPEIGYHHSPEHVWQIGPAFLNFQVLPEMGGLNDQFADEWEDILMWISLHHYCQWEYDSERGVNGKSKEWDPVESWFKGNDDIGDLL